MTKPHFENAINGGPLTLEIHNTVFRNPEGEKKVARLVKSFIDLGGHQLQLNAINRDTLLDAQAHPEQYPNLIVRVWGWSGYFCELDQVYQDHVISRTEFTV
jgi:formate C-acetyltransferase